MAHARTLARAHRYLSEDVELRALSDEVIALNTKVAVLQGNVRRRHRGLSGAAEAQQLHAPPTMLEAPSRYIIGRSAAATAAEGTGCGAVPAIIRSSYRVEMDELQRQCDTARRALHAARAENSAHASTMVQLQQSINLIHARLVMATGARASDAGDDKVALSPSAASSGMVSGGALGAGGPLMPAPYRPSFDAASPVEVLASRIREVSELCSMCTVSGAESAPFGAPLGSTPAELSEQLAAMMRNNMRRSTGASARNLHKGAPGVPVGRANTEVRRRRSSDALLPCPAALRDTSTPPPRAGVCGGGACARADGAPHRNEPQQPARCA